MERLVKAVRIECAGKELKALDSARAEPVAYGWVRWEEEKVKVEPPVQLLLSSYLHRERTCCD